jgi:mannosyl-3-phosphoglycerate phosphatase
MQKIIFTDLDGTLLDKDTYSAAKAKKALQLVKKEKIPLIFCSSKTRAEIEYHRKKLKNNHPFISENGSAIFIPRNYFDFSFRYHKKNSKYFIIILGRKHKKIAAVVKKIKKKYRIKTFSDMGVKELAEDSGLPLIQASLAKKREFSETFKVLDDKDKKNIIREVIKNGLRCITGGRYYHILDNDKGKAVRILSELYKKKYRKILTMGFGDSKNDFEMLDNVDRAYLVMQKNKKYASKKYKHAAGIGPKGWNKAVKKELTLSQSSDKSRAA